MPNPLLVVDGPFLLYRSFFALPESIKGVDGRPIGALLGGTNVLLRAAGDYSPRAIVVCWGAEAAAYRTELSPPYHADRPPVRPDDCYAVCERYAAWDLPSLRRALLCCARCGVSLTIAVTSRLKRQ